MKSVRLIARLDIKSEKVIKGIQMEGLRRMGDPAELATKYYHDGADELLYIDCVASLYGRNSLHNMIEYATSQLFVPVTVGGGIRSLDDVRAILRSGADKISLNKAALEAPEIITQIAETFGAQCVVLSVEAKKSSNGKWNAFYDCGRQDTGKDVVGWVKEAVKRGAGEVLVTSVDRDGTKSGFDIELMCRVREAVSVPVIASGGAGSAEHIACLIKEADCDAVAIGSLLHYQLKAFPELRKELQSLGVAVRAYHPKR